jgi:hemoglobin
VRPSLYEHAGGDAAFLALASAFHARCLADPVLEHPFSHADGNPQHVPNLAAYWAEVLGGPPRYSDGIADQSFLLRLHAGNGPMDELGRRFVDAFVAAADDALLPADEEFRAALRAYMVWAVADVLVYAPEGSEVPSDVPMPHWSWDGLFTDR